jgi:hypothetical protein
MSVKLVYSERERKQIEWMDDDEASMLNKAIDQNINSAAKTYYMSVGQISVPIVFRGPNGAAAGVGAQHSHVCYMSLQHLLLFSISVSILCIVRNFIPLAFYPL